MPQPLTDHYWATSLLDKYRSMEVSHIMKSNFALPSALLTLSKVRVRAIGLRFSVLKRDEFKSQYCGCKAPEVELHVGHVIPWKVVKEHDANNLVTACAEGNVGKADKLLTDY